MKPRLFHSAVVWYAVAAIVGINLRSSLSADLTASEHVGTPLRLVTASFIGTAADDDLQGAYGASDGTIYLVGNLGAAAKMKAQSSESKVFGRKSGQPKCGRGFVAHFSGDMSKLLHMAEFEDGIAILTSIQANFGGIYVSGYATAELEPLLTGKSSFISKYPLAKEADLIAQGKMLEANGLADKDPIADRPGLGRFGAPCVLKLSADLQTIEAGTYLEGWQQVWDKARVKSIKPHETFPPDYFWQPTSLALTKSGDVVVCHDGGYFRLLNDEDRKRAADNPELLKRLAFYDCCDYLSRLSPDLSKRVWRESLYTPGVNAETAKAVKNGWPLEHYSSPRTTRMRLDKDENIYLCGWSASATAKEPWWSPYLWKMSASTGKPIWKAYEYDPMSGKENRLLGNVADTAIASVAVDRQGNLLAGLYADGGNSVIGWSPVAELGKKFEGRVVNQANGIKLVHWWGAAQRIDSQTREGLAGATFASRVKNGPAGPAFPVDLAALSDNQTLLVGRCNFELPWTDNAWHKGDPDENPTAFLRVYSEAFQLRFSTALPGVVPFEIVPLSENRYLIVGQAVHATAPVKQAYCDQTNGKSDGYFMLVEETSPFTAK